MSAPNLGHTHFLSMELGAITKDTVMLATGSGANCKLTSSKRFQWKPHKCLWIRLWPVILSLIFKFLIFKLIIPIHASGQEVN